MWKGTAEKMESFALCSCDRPLVVAGTTEFVKLRLNTSVVSFKADADLPSRKVSKCAAGLLPRDYILYNYKCLLGTF